MESYHIRWADILKLDIHLLKHIRLHSSPPDDFMAVYQTMGRNNIITKEFVIDDKA